MAEKHLVVGARGSLLSVTQANKVIALLRKAAPGYSFSLRKITTSGDRVKNWQRDSVGIFVKELEEALLNQEIDIAVHSAKDMPSSLSPGLRLAAVPRRESPYDCVIFKEKGSLASLKKGSLIATGSPRRRAQLLGLRPDLEIRSLRGNLDSRLKKLRDEDFSAIIAAYAGIKRLKYKGLFLEVLQPETMLPAAGQGTLAIETRKSDKTANELAGRINHPPSLLCLACERAFLKEIGAGCRLPVACLARIKNNRIFLQAAVSSASGKKIIRLGQGSKIEEGQRLGRSLAKEILRQGGDKILKARNQ